MTTPLIKSFRASAGIAGHLIARATGDRSVAASAAPTAPILGVVSELGADAGTMADLTLSGWAEVRYGGEVSFGDPLTADALGRAVKAEPQAGATVRTVGFAMIEAATGDIGPLLVAPGLLNPLPA